MFMQGIDAGISIQDSNTKEEPPGLEIQTCELFDYMVAQSMKMDGTPKEEK